MLYSMTGYGKATGTFEGKKISVEMKALNSKSMDLFVRIAPPYREKELAYRQHITNRLDRGKVEVSISIDQSGSAKPVEINKDLAKAYYQDLMETNQLIGQKSEDYLSLIIRMPEIYIQSKDAVSEEEFVFVDQLVDEACTNLTSFRRQEGIALEKEFSDRIGEIRLLLSQVEPFETSRIDVVKERIRKGLEELGNIAGYDENRFQQELIFYIEKMDISEEKMRLANHLDYFLETMKTPSAGKKLGFITQEIGREINTLGSKSYHVELQKMVVDMKDALEKIKEQVLNTL
jgi:uncharacterized protein (TIGR00255 family)